MTSSSGRGAAWVRPTPFLLLAVWFGLLAGGLELAGHGVRRFVLGEFVFLGPDVIWTAPLVTAVLYGILALPFLAASRIAPRPFGIPTATGWYAFLAVFGLLYVFPQIHRLAGLLLAAGIGIQSWRWASRHPRRLTDYARRTTGPLLLFVAALGIGLHTARWWSERRALAQLPPASPSAPNVLLIVLDTVRAFNLSLYGYARPTTPVLRRLAQGGVRFDRAFATASWTLPSHATMFTGRLPLEFDASWFVPLDDHWPTLAEVLRKQGYVPAGFAANTDYVSREVGLARGFVHFEDYTLSLGRLVKSSSLSRAIARNHSLRQLLGNEDALARKTAPDMNRAVLRWFDKRRDPQRPFFVFVNYYDAHRPYLPPPPFDRMFVPPGTEPDPRLERAAAPGDSARVDRTVWAINAYDGGLAYLDSQIGLLFAELNQRGLLRSTIVIITSDHGEEFGEHGLFDHGNSLYRQALQVPLVVTFPQHVPAGSIVTEPVSLRDLPATIVDLAGFADQSPFPGHSLARLWSGPDNETADTIVASVRKAIREPEWYPASKGDLASVAEGGLRYIRNFGSGQEQIYDFEEDTLETRDLIQTERGQAALSGLRSTLEAVSPDVTGERR